MDNKNELLNEEKELHVQGEWTEEQEKKQQELYGELPQIDAIEENIFYRIHPIDRPKKYQHNRTSVGAYPFWLQEDDMYFGGQSMETLKSKHRESIAIFPSLQYHTLSLKKIEDLLQLLHQIRINIEVCLSTFFLLNSLLVCTL